MQEIQLTQGQIALVDDEDFERVNSFGKWHAQLGRTGIWYAVSFMSLQGQRIRPLMHRFILKLAPTHHPIVDHRNRIGTDNRRENLRVKTQSINAHNAKVRKNNLSGATGVSFIAATQNWKATMYVNGVQHHLGFYQDAASAIEARKTAEERFWANVEDQTPVVWKEFDYSRNELSSNNTSGFTGVYYSRGKYRASVMVKGTTIALGVHDTAELANQARLRYLNRESN